MRRLESVYTVQKSDSEVILSLAYVIFVIVMTFNLPGFLTAETMV